MTNQERLQQLLADDPLRMEALRALQALQLPDGWIGAGFVRDAVWDHLHGYGQRPISGDVDVVWFDALHRDPHQDRILEAQLKRQWPTFNWSVKNQARMHQRHGHEPYHSTRHALQYWPETATAVAVRLEETQGIATIAPYGLDDLFALRLRPTPSFEHQKLPVFRQRAIAKRWMERYPGLQLVTPG